MHYTTNETTGNYIHDISIIYNTEEIFTINVLKP